MGTLRVDRIDFFQITDDLRNDLHLWLHRMSEPGDAGEYFCRSMYRRDIWFVATARGFQNVLWGLNRLLPITKCCYAGWQMVESIWQKPDLLHKQISSLLICSLLCFLFSRVYFFQLVT